MEDDLTDFALWLRKQAAAAGYDPDQHGGAAALARASGVDVAQLSRALRGKSIPSGENVIRLGRALGVPIPEIAARVLGWRPETEPPPMERPLTVEEVAERWGITNDDRDILYAVVEQMRKHARERSDGAASAANQAHA